MTATAWRSRIVGHADVAPSDLVPNPANWRTHPADQQGAITGALTEVGWVTEVIVNQTTGHIVDGHLRVELAAKGGEASVPVTYVELTEDEERLVLTTLDPIAAMAGAESSRLAELLDTLEPSDVALRALLDDLGRDYGIDTPRPGLVDPDEAPDLPDLAAVTVKTGELYALGDHRLLCGDSTKQEDVHRVLGGELADLIWTDPPYGVAYQTKLSVEEAVARRRRTDGLEVSNDALGDIGTRALISAAIRPDYLKPGGCFYVASPSGDMEIEFRLALIEAGLPLREAIVWVKDVFVMGRQDYHWRHESILYGWRDGAAHYFGGGRTQDTVWEIARPKRSQEHPTMKPVELVGRAIENSSRPGDTVFDPFAGSGTTVIASEQLGRRARAIELDPRYAQVVITRWETFTGRQAERVDG